MQKKIIDLRSDTLTTPDKKMLEACLVTEMGDEFYEEAFATKKLEMYCAELFGKEAGLFVPSGMMANLIAAKTYTNPGDTILTHSDYYIAYFQSRPIIQYCSVNINSIPPIKNRNSFLEIDIIHEILHSTTPQVLASRVKLLWIENTINALSGKVYPLEKMRELHDYALAKNIPLHVDGARILNACISKKISPKEYAKHCDSLSISFSKGLSSPFGSILLGSKEFIQKSKVHKKEFGGGLHQSDVITNMCLYAIKNNIHYLEKDNENAQSMAKIFENIPELGVVKKDIDSNIIMLNLEKFGINSRSFCNILYSKNIRVYPWNEHTLRLVTHKNVDSEEADYAALTIVNIVKSLRIGKND